MPTWFEDKDVWSRRFSAWGSMLVTASIFLLLGYVLVVTSRIDDKQAFNGLSETIKAMAMISVGFWLGSSNSKQQQDESLAANVIEQNKTIATTAAALATSAPVAPLAVTATVDPGQPLTATTTAPGAATEEKEPPP